MTISNIKKIAILVEDTFIQVIETNLTATDLAVGYIDRFGINKVTLFTIPTGDDKPSFLDLWNRILTHMILESNPVYFGLEQ